jgi:Ribbon-helix-helix protein, copG family
MALLAKEIPGPFAGSPMWCIMVNVVYYGEFSMTAKMKRAKRSGKGTKMQSTVRASISFPPDIYETLEALAKQKKVSLAWVVRDAAEKYIADLTLAAGE